MDIVPEIIFWSSEVQLIKPPRIIILDDCLISISEGILNISSPPQNNSNSILIANVKENFIPKTNLKFPQAPKPYYLTITAKGELLLEDFDMKEPLNLHLHYLFALDSKKINPINEVCFCYDDVLLFFQGEYNFEAENSKSSFFFEIPIDFSTEIDVVSFQTRKNRENHNRLVVHSSGLIQFKPQLSTFLSGCFYSKMSGKNEQFELEILEKKVVSSNVKGYVLKGMIVVIEGLIEFEEEKNNRSFALVKNEKIWPKQELKVVNCLKEKWDFTVVSVGVDGKITSSKGKTVWVNIVYFI